VLFEMLTGEPPFADQKGGMAKMWAHVNAEPTAVSESQGEAPAALEAVMRRAMAKAPEARPSAAAFRLDVLDASGQLP
jgi:eukaryotic-like serine/threonine-protein kinase